MSKLLEEDLNHMLQHTQPFWGTLANQRIFITGGTGFFGCWLLESFTWANEHLDIGAKAVVLTRDWEAFNRKAPHLANNQAIQFVNGDVETFNFPTGEFRYIIHAATSTSEQLNYEYPLVIFDTIVEGTRRVLEFAGQCGAQKFLYISSGASYGKQPPNLTHIPEDYPGAPDPTDPRSAYGCGKRAAEALCTLYASQYGFEIKIARCFAFVGPYMPLDAHFAIGNFIRDGLNGNIIEINGDGTPYRSYLYAADLAIWLWTILFQGDACKAYNVGAETEITILQLADLVASDFQPRKAVRIKHTPKPGTKPERYVPLTKLAREELGLVRWVDLDEAIRRTILWNQKE